MKQLSAVGATREKKKSSAGQDAPRSELIDTLRRCEAKGRGASGRKHKMEMS